MSARKTPEDPRPPAKRLRTDDSDQITLFRQLDLQQRSTVASNSDWNSTGEEQFGRAEWEQAVEDTSSPPPPPSNILEALPSELLAECFFGGYLDTLAVVSSVSCVSKQVSHIARKSVKILDLRQLDNLTEETLQNLVSRFHNVSEVDLSSCTKVGRSHLLRMIPWIKTLKHLRLKGMSLDIADFLEAANNSLDGQPTHLEELDLSVTRRSVTRKIGDRNMRWIADSCPKLRTLKLGWCKTITDESITPLKKLEFLTTLDLSLTSLGDEGCRTLFHIKSLKHLDLSATKVGSLGLRNLLKGKHHAERPPQLETLYLRHLNNDISPESLALLGTSGFCLKYIDVEHSNAAKHKEVLQSLKEQGMIVVPCT